MLAWIADIQIFCFAASYGVALALELSRLFFRAPVRVAVMVGFLIAGLAANSFYLWSQADRNLAEGIAPLSSWFYWCIIGAAVAALANLVATLRRPESSLGLFLLPLALALIGAAEAFGDAQPFSTGTALFRWGVVHGLTLLLGTITIVVGFVAGALYLWQAYRLKHKMPTGRGFKLPSLEVLQRLNAQSLHFSTIFLVVGLLAGILLNVLKSGSVPWTDPLVITSLVLLVWLLVALVFELVYRPARQGQKVAYLTVASFVIFTLVLGILLVGETAHGTSQLRYILPPLRLAAGAALGNLSGGAP